MLQVIITCINTFSNKTSRLILLFDGIISISPFLETSNAECVGSNLARIKINPNKNQKPQTLGDFIRSRREQLGLTQAQLSSLAKLNQGFLAQIEKNTKIGSPETLLNIAKVLGIEPAHSIFAFLDQNIKDMQQAIDNFLDKPIPDELDSSQKLSLIDEQIALLEHREKLLVAERKQLEEEMIFLQSAYNDRHKMTPAQQRQVAQRLIEMFLAYLEKLPKEEAEKVVEELTFKIEKMRNTPSTNATLNLTPKQA